MQSLAQRYRLVISYKGTNFCGLQKQPYNEKHSKNGLPSVQGCIEKAIQKFSSNDEITLSICGRTDAGVHAYANVGHVDIIRKNKRSTNKPDLEPLHPATLKKALNFELHKLTKEVYINTIEAVVNPDFHARFSCLSRSYVYKIMCSPDLLGCPFEQDSYWYISKNLDVALMQEACQVFVGEHDFTAFCTKTEGKDPNKTLDILEVSVSDSPYGSSQKVLSVYVKSKSFLYHQVRKMVGGLVAVGSKEITVQKLRECLEARNPGGAPAMAPAHGLYFKDAEYPQYTILQSSEDEVPSKVDAREIQLKRKREDNEEGEQKEVKKSKEEIIPIEVENENEVENEKKKGELIIELESEKNGFKNEEKYF
jgi:tRNA pseudouridine38-40 synthase